jgi:hypothetical protein
LVFCTTNYPKTLHYPNQTKKITHIYNNDLAHAPVSEEDELWAELERIKDARALREKFYAEHQLMREQLNMAGRFGLDLQQSLEQAQRAEQESYAQVTQPLHTIKN